MISTIKSRLAVAVGGVLALLAASGCNFQDNLGYPETVKLDNRGDTMVIYGQESMFDFEIIDYDGNGVTSCIPGDVIQDEYNGVRPDTVSVTYKWLTVKARRGERRLTLIAEPLKSKSSRRLYIFAHLLPNQYTEIKVVQKSR